MELVGQAVPHRDGGILGQFFHNFLSVTPVFNAVINRGQDPGGVGNGFLLADLRAGGIQIGNTHAQIVGCYFKRAAGAGAGLFKDQGNVLAFA